MVLTLPRANMTRPAQATDRLWLRSALATVIGAALLSLTGSASADRLTIRRPGDHPDYVFEAEPHLNIGLIDPPGIGTGKGIGLGLRGTVELVDNGFVQTINNTVGLGVGVDYVHHGIDEARRTCLRTQADPLDPQDEVCLEFREGESVDYLVIPIVMQWNFWLSEQWSVFGEPGGMLYLLDDGSDDADLQVDVSAYAGGRWHFAEFGALTMRLGYPAFSVGVSFLF
jgi:hypothetical protein